MKMVPFVCPNCGGQLNVAEGKTHMKCGWCGSDLSIHPDGVDNVTATVNVTVKIKRDEARIREADVADSHDRRQHDFEMTKLKVKLVFSGIYAIILLIMFLLGVFLGGFYSLIAGYLFILAIPIAIFLYVPDNNKNKR